MREFTLPSLGADMDEGKLIEWLVKPGDEVHKGQVVAVVDTSKAAIDVEIWYDGVVGQLKTVLGETVQVGAVMATILDPGEAPREPGAPATEPDHAPAQSEPGASATEPDHAPAPPAATPPNWASISPRSPAPAPSARSPWRTWRPLRVPGRRPRALQPPHRRNDRR